MIQSFNLIILKMKNLLFICALLLTSTGLFSQTVTVGFEDFINAKPMDLSVISANLQVAPVLSTNGQTSNKRVYVVTRMQDATSNDIMDGINKGRLYKKVKISVKLPNGTSIVHELTNVIMLEYGTINVAGQKPTEQFYLQFQIDQIVGSK